MTDSEESRGLPTAAVLCKRTKNPGLDLERTVDDVVRLVDKDTTIEGIKESISYEIEETGELVRRQDVLDLIDQQMNIVKKAKTDVFFEDSTIRINEEDLSIRDLEIVYGALKNLREEVKGDE